MKMTNLNLDFCYKEYTTLREEANGIKKAQLWFINVSLATTGVLLGIGVKENFPLPLAIAYLFPLIILLPSWHLFFDKAITYARIIGYLKVLEKIIIKPELVKNFTGWENALVIFRGRQQQKILQQKQDEPKFFKEMHNCGHLTSVRYWRISYIIFSSLSALCIFLSLFTLVKLTPELFVIPCLIVAMLFIFMRHFVIFCFLSAFCMLLIFFPFKLTPELFVIPCLIVAILFMYHCCRRNFDFLCQLAWGRYSYRVNEFLWKQILLNKMILEPERLIEYGDDSKDDDSQQRPWRSKALNFEGRELNFQDYNTLYIAISTTEMNSVNVLVQLLDSLEPQEVNRAKGLDGETYIINPKVKKEIRIPLSEFKNSDINKIYRLVIHYGQNAFGRKLNETNNAKINIEEIELQQ